MKRKKIIQVNSSLCFSFFFEGMTNIGIIWQYGEYPDVPQMIEQNKTSSLQLNDIKHEYYPFLGRRVELMIVATQIMLLDEPVDSSKRPRDLAALIFEGKTLDFFLLKF